MSSRLFNSVYCTVICMNIDSGKVSAWRETPWRASQHHQKQKGQWGARANLGVVQHSSIWYSGGYQRLMEGMMILFFWVFVHYNCTELPLEHLSSRLVLTLLRRQWNPSEADFPFLPLATISPNSLRKLTWRGNRRVENREGIEILVI